MKREDLKTLGLTDERIDAVMAEHGKALNAEKEKVAALQAQLTQRDADIASLKESTGANDDLKQQLTDWQAKYQTETEKLRQQLQDQRLDAAVDREISKAKGRNSKAIKALIDREKLELLEDGTLKGLDITALQTSDPYLFEITQTRDEGADPQSGSGNSNHGVSQAAFQQNINNVQWMQDNLEAVTKGLADGTLKKG